MSKGWYVLQSKPNNENFLAGQLEYHSIEYFFPQLKVPPVNPRCRKIRPYFPGYLFVKMDLAKNDSLVLDRIPGAIGWVYLGGEVAYVPENLIHEIREHVNDINALGGKEFNGIKKGDAVKVHSGPFQGYEAIFDARISGSERVRVFLLMLHKRILPVELPVGFISPIGSPRFHGSRK